MYQLVASPLRLITCHLLWTANSLGYTALCMYCGLVLLLEDLIHRIILIAWTACKGDFGRHYFGCILGFAENTQNTDLN